MVLGGGPLSIATWTLDSVPVLLLKVPSKPMRIRGPVLRRREELRENHDRWLVSYADFITLLFSFFVVLFASSTVDQSRMQSFAARFESLVRRTSKADGGFLSLAVSSSEQLSHEALTLQEMAPTLEQLEAELFPEIQNGKIELSMEPRGLVMSLNESALFAPGDAAIQPESKAVIRKVARALRRTPGQIRLEGHTDNTPINTRKYPSNWQLSTARAISVLQFLMEEGLASERLSAAGYGEHRPLAPNDTEENRAKNRRVDVVILAKNVTEAEPMPTENYSEILEQSD